MLGLDFVVLVFYESTGAQVDLDIDNVVSVNVIGLHAGLAMKHRTRNIMSALLHVVVKIIRVQEPIGNLLPLGVEDSELLDVRQERVAVSNRGAVCERVGYDVVVCKVVRHLS